MEETYEHILKAAYEVFSTEGYQNASMNKIKDVAGISKGAIYHYFKSKEELYLKILEYFINEFYNALENMEILDLNTIREMGLQYIKKYKEDEQIKKFLIDFFMQSMQNEKIKIMMNEFLEKAISFFEKRIEEMKGKNLIRESVNSNMLAQKIFVILDCLGMYISIDASAIESEKLWVDFIDDYLKQYFN